MVKLSYQELHPILSSIDTSIFDMQSLQATDVTQDEAFMILSQAVSAFYFSLTLKNISTTAAFNSENVSFASFLAMTHRLAGSHAQNDNEQVGRLLASWNNYGESVSLR